MAKSLLNDFKIGGDVIDRVAEVKPLSPGLVSLNCGVTTPQLPPAGESRAQEAWRFNSKSQRWELTKAGLNYKVSGVKNHWTNSLRVSVRVEAGSKKFIDHVDLYSSRSRNGFKEGAAVVLGVEAAAVEQELLGLLDRLEEEAQKEEEVPQEPELSQEEKALGMKFLTSARMFEEIVADMESLGHVGEEVNKKLIYLAASSRKLESPVSVVIVSQSAAGKSFLIDTVRQMMPSEDVVNLTSLSDQALNYMSEGALKNKLLILGEAVHNEVVEHQIREMLSAKELSRMVVSKDEQSGKMVSKVVRHKAVVSLMMSTTSHDMNAENASRCFFVHADESPEQTKRIHQQQRRQYTLQGIKAREQEKPQVIAKHQAAQRLLKPVMIVNPYDEEQGKEFPSTMMRSRRDNKQLCELIAAVCYLRQYQKKVKTEGQMSFIECDRYDVELAWELFRGGVMKAIYLELPESLVSLYEEIRALCRQLAQESGLEIQQVSFDQGSLRKRVKWLGGESIKKYLKKLVGMEYLLIKSGFMRGQRLRYQLVEDQSLEELCGLDGESAGKG